MEGLNDQLTRESGQSPSNAEGRSNQTGFEEGGATGSSSGIGQGIPVTGDIMSTDGVTIERVD